MTITWPLILVCALLVATIGGGGYMLGHQNGYDRGERDRSEWCDRHHQAAAPDELDELGPCPFTSQQPTRPPQAIQRGRHALEAATWPLPWPADGDWLPGHTLDAPPSPTAAPSPAAVELDVAHMIARNELEIQHLIHRAELEIGEITDGR